MTRDDLKRQMILLGHKVPASSSSMTAVPAVSGATAKPATTLVRLTAKGNMYGRVTRESSLARRRSHCSK